MLINQYTFILLETNVNARCDYNLRTDNLPVLKELFKPTMINITDRYVQSLIVGVNYTSQADPTEEYELVD